MLTYNVAKKLLDNTEQAKPNSSANANDNAESNDNASTNTNPLANLNPLDKANPLAKINPLANDTPLAKLNPLANDNPLAKVNPLANGNPVAKLNPLNNITNGGATNGQTATPYEAGESFGDFQAASTGLLNDLTSTGLGGIFEAAQALLTTLEEKNKAEDDKNMQMEKLMAFMTKMPRTSKTRHELSMKTIDKLWNSMQHPPLSYLGDKYKYRTPDGSYNNVLNPSLGQAGTPYAKTVRSEKKLAGVKPDAGMLFDLLLDRDMGEFKENPAGLSSMLFYHATIIIHDIFRTSRIDHNISETSSYVDLAPLYGSSLKDQQKIRTMSRGLLKPDTFHEKRLLGQPPGVNVLLVLYSRFHNYVAEMLLQINEDGKFALGPYDTDEEKTKAILKQDNDLFQTARLVVGGLYGNIALHDYLRGLTNTHATTSDWTLDPRLVGTTYFDHDGVPRGVGNQVSIEFNLLYRFHSAISQRDEKWLIDFFNNDVFPGNTKPLHELDPREFMDGLFRFEASIPLDPEKREFGGLKRGEDGKFRDEDLVRILKESIEDPAGAFGARTIPKALRMVEVLGILQARKWGCASLNETRDFFKLKRHQTFEDVNPDPEIAGILRNLYTHPDMVEMYPGMFIEAAKPAMNPGSGVCLPYTASRAVFSDAVTLVRSDRFLTLDFTVDTLTNWGLAEVTQDYDTLGGSMYYKLIQRTVPGWFPYNSLHVMQPLFTRARNEQIARSNGTIDLYTLDDPAPPRRRVILTKYDTVMKVLTDSTTFRTPWTPGIRAAVPDRDLTAFMVFGDGEANVASRKTLANIMRRCGDVVELTTGFVKEFGAECLKAATFHMTKTLDQVDIIRDVAIPVNARLVADMYCLDLITDENPSGTISNSEMYKLLMDLRVWSFLNVDEALKWNRRRWAQQAAAKLTRTTTQLSSTVLHEQNCLFGALNPHLFGLHVDRPNKTKPGSMREYGRRFVTELVQTAGKTPEETVDLQWLMAYGGIGGPVTQFAQVLEFFFRPENQVHWVRLQDLAASKDPSSDATIRSYVLEAWRHVGRGKVLRVCAKPTTINDQKFEPGDAVVSLLGEALRDPTAEPISDPEAFLPGRPKEAYRFYFAGQHTCLGDTISTAYSTALIRLVAGLKELRPAPGEMGELKSIFVGGDQMYLSENWAYLTSDPTSMFSLTLFRFSSSFPLSYF
ncbi:heme peroxidase [Pseudomassariella vexata]|uniref:Heme peroxidase n=1 Tax=Pseudomassariella vexata TaxID=1141098 RepID=A0A1Y2EAE1_9PEZI|nr:heme peroxidase [Pseudomassariella vexata]ORY68274.1 heme peroxidase [Pseudomassariella vexata]